MRAILKILQRSLVIEFYKQNAAFFGLMILVLFGFIRGNEHLMIGAFLVTNPSALVFLYFLWVLYVGKVILFLLPTIHKPENRFLESFLLFDNKVKRTAVLSASVVLLMPALIYGGFLIFLATTEQIYLSVISILGSLVMLSMGLSFFIYYQLQKVPHEKQIFQIRFFKRMTIPSQLFFISFILRKEIVLLLLTKIYSCILIIGTSALYNTDNFDLRLMTTGILLASVANVAILHKYIWFQYNPMAFSQNLPLRFPKVVMHQIFSIVVISVPEILVLLRHYPLSMNALDVFGLLLFIIGLNYLMYAWMIRNQVELSNFIVVVFWLVVVTTFFILFSVHSIILGFISLAISMIIVYFRHYQYEHSE